MLAVFPCWLAPCRGCTELLQLLAMHAMGLGSRSEPQFVPLWWDPKLPGGLLTQTAAEPSLTCVGLGGVGIVPWFRPLWLGHLSFRQWELHVGLRLEEGRSSQHEGPIPSSPQQEGLGTPTWNTTTFPSSACR